MKSPPKQGPCQQLADTRHAFACLLYKGIIGVGEACTRGAKQAKPRRKPDSLLVTSTRTLPASQQATTHPLPVTQCVGRVTSWGCLAPPFVAPCSGPARLIGRGLCLVLHLVSHGGGLGGGVTCGVLGLGRGLLSLVGGLLLHLASRVLGLEGKAPWRSQSGRGRCPSSQGAGRGIGRTLGMMQHASTCSQVDGMPRYDRVGQH